MARPSSTPDGFLDIQRPDYSWVRIPAIDHSCPDRGVEQAPDEVFLRLRRAAQTVVDSARQSRHVVEFSKTGYGLQHPLSCRPYLLSCPVHLMLAAMGKPAQKPGRYTVDAEGKFTPTDRIDPLVGLSQAIDDLSWTLVNPEPEHVMGPR